MAHEILKGPDWVAVMWDGHGAYVVLTRDGRTAIVHTNPDVKASSAQFRMT